MTIDESIQVLCANVMVAVDRADMGEACSKMVEDALNMAIASLEAWEKVKADIISESDNKSNNMQFNLGLLAALAIINGHFKEVGNGQTE